MNMNTPRVDQRDSFVTVSLKLPRIAHARLTEKGIQIQHKHGVYRGAPDPILTAVLSLLSQT